MRLIDTDTLEFREVLSSGDVKYAILSHRWSEHELSFQGYQARDRPIRERSIGDEKIVKCCELAKARGIPYAWVDTCCINRMDLVELTESFQSMFQWYRDAEVCFAFLSDLVISEHFDGTPSLRELRRCDWFKRGWTLQELLAPRSLEFYDKSFEFVGGLQTLISPVAEITGIDEKYLSRPDSFRDACLATRMSWASQRHTTRAEDIAYCLLGIFDINMPLFYGEGKKRAFMRLQEHIIERSDDESIFAWDAIGAPVNTGFELAHNEPGLRGHGILAENVEAFRDCGDLRRSNPDQSVSTLRPSYKFSNRGLELSILSWIDPRRKLYTELVLNCKRPKHTKVDDHRGGTSYEKVVIHLRRNPNVQAHLWYRAEARPILFSRWPRLQTLSNAI